MKRAALTLAVTTGLLTGCATPGQHSGSPASSYGWESVNLPSFDPSACTEVARPLVRPVVRGFRRESTGRLADIQIVELTDAEAARLIGVRLAGAKSLAATLIGIFLDEQRARKYRAEIERRDSWSFADQNELVDLETRSATTDYGRYKPYLVRAVANTDQPDLLGVVCGGDLLTHSVLMGRNSVAHPMPAVTFVPKRPARAFVTADRAL